MMKITLDTVIRIKGELTKSSGQEGCLWGSDVRLRPRWQGKCNDLGEEDLASQVEGTAFHTEGTINSEKQRS